MSATPRHTATDGRDVTVPESRHTCAPSRPTVTPDRDEHRDVTPRHAHRDTACHTVTPHVSDLSRPIQRRSRP